MALNLDKARNKVAKSEVRYDGDPIKLEFHPLKLTGDWQVRYQQAENRMLQGSTGPGAVIDAILEVLHGWDLEADLDRVYADAYPDEEERRRQTGGRELGHGVVPLERPLVEAAELPVMLYNVMVQNMLQESADQTKSAKKG